MSTHKRFRDVIQEVEHWLRLATFLHEPLKLSFLYILHNNGNDPSYTGLPRDPKDLYNFFDNHQKTIKDLWNRKSLAKEQVLTLLPPSGKTHSDQFDCTLVAFVIRNFVNLPRPACGWNCKTPPITDQSVSANCIRAREWRNNLHHTDPKRIDEAEFNKKWDEGVEIIKKIGLYYDTVTLKTMVLDPQSYLVIQSLETYIVDASNTLAAHEKSLAEHDHSIAVHDKSIAEHEKSISEHDQSLIDLKKENEHLRNRLQLVKEEVEKMMVWKKNEVSDGAFVLKEAIDVVCQNIGEKWKELADRLFDDDILRRIDDYDDDNLPHAEKLRNCFKLVKDKVTWSKLKQCLLFMEESEIIEKVKLSTLLTEGRKAAHNALKQTYRKALVNWLSEQPFVDRKDSVFVECPSGDAAYVDLAIIEAKEIDEIWSDGDLNSHLQQKHFNRRNIAIEEVLTSDEDFVIVRGIAGIGKSTIVQSYVKRWIDCKILIGEGANEAKIDFLFKFTCRELNTMMLENINVRDLLHQTYPDVFKYISLEELNENASSVLIMVDGIDELRSISCLTNIQGAPSDDRQLLQCVKELLNTESPFLNGHKTMVSGRPEACQLIDTIFRNNKMVEICGFNSESVKRYVQNYFWNDNIRAQQILNKIEETSYLRAMASIPVYLWVICGIFNETSDLMIKTTTELCSYACLLFIRNHLKMADSSYKDVLLTDLCCRSEVMDVILSLAVLSLRTYQERKVLFTVKDIPKNISIDLEKTGFIVKYKTDRHETYQFRHLVLQEYLSAVMLLVRGKKSIIKDPDLKSCFPVVAGLCGIDKSCGDMVLTDFLSHLKQRYKRRSLIKILFSPLIKLNINIKDILEKRIMKCFVKRDYISISDQSSNLLAAIYEYQGEFSGNLLGILQQRKLQIYNLMLQHDINNVVYFTEKLNIEAVDGISINNVANNKLPDNFTILLSRYFGNIGKKVVRFYITDSDMKINTNSHSNDKTTIFMTLKKADTNNTHGNIIGFLIGLVDVVELSAPMYDTYDNLIVQLKNYLPLIKNMVIAGSGYWRFRVDNIFLRADLPALQYLKIEAGVFSADDIYYVILLQTKLQTLDLSSNHMVRGRFDSRIPKAIDSRHNTNGMLLRELILDKCSLDDDDVICLKSCLTKIVKISLKSNAKLTNQSVICIADACQVESALEELDISYCGIENVCFTHATFNLINLAGPAEEPLKWEG